MDISFLNFTVSYYNNSDMEDGNESFRRIEMKILISGLGIIGGSYARALKKYTDHYIIGVNRSEDPLREAIECGAIDEIGTEESVAEADLIILGTFPKAAVEFVSRNAGRIPKKCIVMDTCGIKSDICPQLTRLARDNGFTFVGVHPMAGKEKNGFSASEADLFKGASCIIVPGEAGKDAVEVVSRLAEKIGFGRVVYTTPENHDRMIAFTSQIPHVIACAYVQSPCCPDHNGYSAGSYRDVSRVAHINEKLWAELFTENRQALLGEIDELMLHLTEMRTALENNDRQELERIMAKSRKVKEELGE